MYFPCSTFNGGQRPFNSADLSGEVYLSTDFCFSLPVGMAYTTTIYLIKKNNMCTKYPRFSYALSHVVLCLEASCAIIFTVANPFWQSPVVFGIVSKNSHICEITGDTWRKWLGSSNQNVFLKFVWLIFLKWEINCIVQNTKQATPPCHGSIMCVGLKREITFEFLTLGIASACCSAVKPTLLKRRQDSIHLEK